MQGFEGHWACETSEGAFFGFGVKSPRVKLLKAFERNYVKKLRKYTQFIAQQS